MLLLPVLLSVAFPFGPWPEAPPPALVARTSSLAEQLTVSDEKARARAVADLVSLGPSATEPLLELLKNTSPERAEAVRSVLPKFGPQALPWFYWASNRTPFKRDIVEQAALQAAAQMGAAILPGVRTMVESGDDSYRFFGFRILAKMGPDATDLLIRLLKNKDHDVRAAAARVVFERQDPRSADALLEGLGSDDRVVRMYSAHTLGWLRDHRAAEQLVGLLQDPSPSMREAAGAALAKIYEARFLEPLLRLIRWDDDAGTRESTARSMIERSQNDLAIRLARRYRPLSYDAGAEQMARLIYGIWLIASVILFYAFIWLGARFSGEAMRLGIPAASWWSLAALVAFGFYWGRLIVHISGSVELWLLLACVPGAALLSWVAETRPWAPVVLGIGCLGSFALVLVAPLFGQLGPLLLGWLAPRMLWGVAAILIGILIATVALRTNARVLTPFRRATLFGTLAFYAGYGIGWLALWGYLGF